MACFDDETDDIFSPAGKLRLNALSESSVKALREAIRYARSTRWDSVRSPHLFMGVLAAADDGINCWGERLGADLPKLLDQFAELFHQEKGVDKAFIALNREFFSDNVIHLLRDAFQRAMEHERRVTPIDLLITLFTSRENVVAECFERIGIKAADLTELAVIAEQECSQR